mgnify:CR=1 FL=1
MWLLVPQILLIVGAGVLVPNKVIVFSAVFVILLDVTVHFRVITMSVVGIELTVIAPVLVTSA